jgi:hypothetical protein
MRRHARWTMVSTIERRPVVDAGVERATDRVTDGSG